jgi:hypothetical protein
MLPGLETQGVLLDRIRVVVVGSRLLRDIIEQITANQPDIEVSEGVPKGRAVDGSLSAGRTGVLVWAGEDEPDSSRFDELLYKHPRLRIILVREALRRSFLLELRPHRRPLGELGPDDLLAAIRGGGDTGENRPIPAQGQ